MNPSFAIPAKVSLPPRASLGTKVKMGTFLIGSYLTEPFCKAREYYYRISIVDAMNPLSGKVASLARKFFLILSMVGWGAIGLFTTVPGIILRGLGASIEKDPYIFARGASSARPIPQERQISLLSWNVCCVGAGYPITDGGVTPREERYNAILSHILKADTDIVCLYEVFDVATGQYFKDVLTSQGYSYFYYNIGPRAIGTSSAMMVISRVKIGDPRFTPFPKSALVNRTKFAEKGVFEFSVLENKKPVLRVFSTHPQHSEKPSIPSSQEKKARGKEMGLIQGLADKWIKSPVIIVGDLNMNDDELGNYFPNFGRGKWQEKKRTWGGDAWCARLVGKQESGPENLDHILAREVQVEVSSPFDTGYNDQIFQKNAISDHEPLKGIITL